MPPNEVVRCFIAAGGGPVTVTLQANNALMTGSIFTVWDVDGETELESWNLSAGSAGEGSHEIGQPETTLHGTFLTWRITVCAPLPAIQSGIVEIVIAQGGVSTGTTKPLRWELDELPQCDAGEVTVIERGLKFIVD